MTLLVTCVTRFSCVAANIKNVWLHTNFFCVKLKYLWRVLSATRERHYYQDNCIYKGSNLQREWCCRLLPHLVLQHLDLHQPILLCLSTLSGSLKNKTNKNGVWGFFFSLWSIISRRFLLWLRCKSHTYKENVLLCWSLSQKWYSESFQIALLRCAFSFQNKPCTESCCFTWRVAM